MRATWKLYLTTSLGIALAACSDTGPVTAPAESPSLARSTWGDDNAGAVFVASNAVGGNEVLMFRRTADGGLSGPTAFSTGGTGTGTGLGNQGGVVLSNDDRLLLVVNAGSNDLSVFKLEHDGLELLDRVPSGGEQPISVTVNRRLVYVLNAGGDGNITGFRLDWRRKLHPIPNSTRSLSTAASGPAQVSFSPGGQALVVSEKATNVLSLYRVGYDGLATGPSAQPSAGATPFGFAFGRRGILVVSEAFGGAPGASALSSYRLKWNGLQVVSASVGTTETAACWVVITDNGRFAYTTNTGSGSISGYRITPDGGLTLLDADGETGHTGPGPIDMSLSGNSRFLYSLNSGDGTLSAFGVNADGSLTAQAGVSGLPVGANGLAAR